MPLTKRLPAPASPIPSQDTSSSTDKSDDDEEHPWSKQTCIVRRFNFWQALVLVGMGVPTLIGCIVIWVNDDNNQSDMGVGEYNYADFLANEETYSCCATNDGGVPLDKTLKRLVYTKPHGFFIESGGQDGLFQSNTLVAERHFGWTGLLVEPAISLQEKCIKNRPKSECVLGALVEFGGSNAIAAPGGSAMGKTRKWNDTKAFPLSELLDGKGVTNVDLWSLDIEGYKLNALNGVDWERHRPAYVLIKVWEENKHAVFDKMEGVGYVVMPGINGRQDISGWAHYSLHRDYIWKDARKDLVSETVKKRH